MEHVARGLQLLVFKFINSCFLKQFFHDVSLKGEANAHVVGFTPQYACAIKAMVDDWRYGWFSLSPEMDNEFPFGQVQVSLFKDIL